MKKSNAASKLISVGLLFITIPQLLRDHFGFNDFIHGLLFGIGTGLLVTGVVMLKRHGNKCCENGEREDKLTSSQKPQ